MTESPNALYSGHVDQTQQFSDEQLSRALGRQIAAERNAQGMSQEQLGTLAGGVHKNTIYRYETGERALTWGAIKKIAAALRMRPSQLVAAAEERAIEGR